MYPFRLTMIPGDLPFISKKTMFSASTPVLREYCVNLVCSSALCSWLRAADREARVIRRAIYITPCAAQPLEGSSALTVQVVNDLDPGGLGLNGVDESKVVEHGLDDCHVVVVLPLCRSTGSKSIDG